MDHLLLRLLPDGAASWCLGSAPERIALGTPAAAAAAATGCRVTVLVPGAAVTLLAARLPTRQQQRLRQALPYALEDQLAADVETLHFAAAGRRDGDEVSCAVVERAVLKDWLAALEAAGIHADAVLPDLLALPRAAGEWSLLAEAGGVLLRYDELRGLATDTATLPHLLPLLLQQQGERRPSRLRLHDATGDGATDALLRGWCAEQGIELQATTVTGDALTVLAPAALRGEGINLLQGEFSRREKTRQLWRPWRAAAALLAALLLLQGGMAIARYSSLSRADAELDAQIERLYREAFPEAQRVVDAPAQMQQKLAELRRGDAGLEFNRLLLHAGPMLRDSGVQLRALHYSPGLLDIEVTAADLQTLDRLKQALDSGALRAEISSADSNDGAVAGRIALRSAS